MIIVVLFCLLPLLLAVGIEYLVCRVTRRWGWKLAPPLLSAALTALVGVGRYRVWTSAEVGPWTQLIIFPGVPALFLLLGFLLGWRLWRRVWAPRVMEEK